MKLSFLLAGLGLLVGTDLVFSDEEAPAAEAQPHYKLIGDISQQVQGTGIDWTSEGNLSWTLQSDLKHEFSLGQVAFIADHTLYYNLGANSGNALTPQTLTGTIYEAYLRYSPAEALDLSLGKKRFNIGVGQTFTVGDSINPFTSFLDQKTGFRGITASYSPNQWLGWTIALSAERNLGADRWNPATTSPGTDLAKLEGATQVQFLWDKLQWATALCMSPNRTFNPSTGISYDLGGVILTGEAACEFLPQGTDPERTTLPSQWQRPGAWTNPQPSFSTGARYSFTLVTDVDLSFSAEYLYWGQGWSTDQTTAWKSAKTSANTSTLNALRATLPLKGRHHGFLKAGFSGWQKLDLSSLFIVDLQDLSALCQGVLTLYPVEGLDVILTLQEATGGIDSAWSALPVSTSGVPQVWSLGLQTKYHF